MSDAKPLEPMPSLRSDEEAERFVAEADLTESELSGFKPTRFELRRKDKTVSLRLPSELLDAAKAAAAAGASPINAGRAQSHEDRSARIVELRKGLMAATALSEKLGGH